MELSFSRDLHVVLSWENVRGRRVNAYAGARAILAHTALRMRTTRSIIPRKAYCARIV